MKLYLTLLLLAAFAYVGKADFELARSSMAKVTIQTRENASPPELYAASELAAYLEKTTGSKPAGGKPIVIGTLEKNGEELSPDLRKQLSDAKFDAFVISIAPEKVLIVGKDSISALYGTYEFIEKYLGVRFFHPGPLGTHIPEIKELVLKDGTDFQAAGFRQRTLNVCCNSKDFTSTYDWMVRVKFHLDLVPCWQLNNLPKKDQPLYCQSRGPMRPQMGGHNQSRQLIPYAMKATHPEYFALRDGKRVGEKDGIDGKELRVERCLSNPAVLKIIADAYIEALRKNKDTVIKFISEDDADCFCQCEACVKMGTWNGKYSASNYYHAYANEVAKRVLQEFPEANIVYFAYVNYLDVPENPNLTFPGKNAVVKIAMAQCYQHPYDASVPCNKIAVDRMNAWKKRGCSIGLYEYRLGSGGNGYLPHERKIAADFKAMRDLNVIDWLVECDPAEGCTWDKNGERRYELAFLASWRTLYTAARCTWNPDLDIEKLLAETHRLYYGKSAPVMEKYHALRQRLWDNVSGCFFYGGPNRSALCLDAPGSEEELLRYLDEAEALADSPLIKKRIQLDRDCLEVFWRKPHRERAARGEKGGKGLSLYRAEQGSIRIDGKLDETAWLGANAVAGFLKTDGTPAKDDTSVKIAYDEDALYFGLIAYNSNGVAPVKVKAKTHDGAVWSDDSIEIFILPPDTGGKYYQIAVNTAGTVFDAEGIAASLNTAFQIDPEVKVLRDKDTWTYEVRVPFRSINASFNPSKRWYFHFVRTTKNHMPPNSQEWSSVDGLGPRSTAQYRGAILADDLIKNGNFSEMQKDFPKNWTPVGLNDLKIIPQPSGNHIYFKSSGALCGSFYPPKQGTGTKYVLTVKAKGKSVSVRILTRGKPGGSQHELNLGKKELSSEFSEAEFELPFNAEETTNILYIGGEDVTIAQVSCVLVK